MRLKSLLLFAAAALISLISCSHKNSQTEAAGNPDKNILVCYFSATGTTADAARRIADITGADILEITPAARYTDADLDWRDTLSRSYIEMHNREMRPQLADSAADLGKYDVVFIGYPNWWNTAPTIINTFIESNDLSGKLVVPFMTSGGSDIVNSENELHTAYPALRWAKGMLINDASDSDISKWTESILN